MNQPILALPPAISYHVLDKHSRSAEVGCVLLQQQPDGTDKQNSYCSKIRSDTEKKLVITHKERLSVECAELQPRLCVEGNRFTVSSDNQALKWLLAMSDTSGKPAKCRLRLSGLKFDITYHAGINHQAADALS